MIGVVLHYYGSPRELSEAEAFYASIIHRQPTRQQVDRLVERYRAYGRPGPLGATVERIQRLLQDRLNAKYEGDFIVRKAGKHSQRAMDDIVASMLDDGVTRFVSLPLTPFGSRLGTENYHRALRLALGEKGASVPVVPVDRWYGHELFVKACALRLDQALRWLPEHLRKTATVVFTTHSMPRAEKQSGLSLHEQYELWAQRTIAAVGFDEWKLSYRSAPGSDAQWLGPDVLDVIREVAAEGRRAVVICPLPTLIENVEVFEEAGTDAQSVARQLGLEFVRTELLNDSADMLDLLEQLVIDALQVV